MITKVVKKYVSVDSIVLFGSRVRGDFGPASDYDLLVVSEGIPDSFEKRLDLENEIGNELILKGVQVSIIFLTPDELMHSISVPDPLMIEIYHNHKILIDNGFFKKALSKLKPLLKDAVYIPEFRAWRLANAGVH